MPGVPSGRGCDACRQQKKKCDQGKPTCSRCSRLQIQCIGSGQRRFKFKEHQIAGADSQAVTHRKQPSWGQIQFSVLNLPHQPDSETSRLTKEFVSVLEVRDLRYSMATYGLFLYDTPRRIGASKALDAAVTALIASHSILHTQKPSVECLAAWVHALNALRGALCDPKQATSIETLCAIYFVSICQAWLGAAAGDHSSHADGMSYILNTMVVQDLKTQFECRVFITLTAAVIFESFHSPHIQVNPEVMEACITYNVPMPIKNTDGITMQSLHLRHLVDYARVMRDPDPDYDEVQMLYAQLHIETSKFCSYAHEVADPNAASYIADDERRSHIHAGFGLGLSVSAMLNGILRVYHPTDTDLLADAINFVEGCLALAEYNLPYRPLGSSWMTMCLIPAWVIAPDPAQRALAEKYISMYEVEPYEVGILEKADWFRRRLEALRWKVVARAGALGNDGGPAPVIDEIFEVGEGSFPNAQNGCCVM